jgi:hypothetical protein
MSSAIARDPVPRLMVTGQVEEIRLRRIDSHYVDCQIKVRLEFTNRDSVPIIILRHSDENSLQSFIVGGVSLAKSRSNAEARRYVYDLQTWPSTDNSPWWKEFAKKLDAPTPPAAFTRILKPNESWAWSTATRFRFFYKAWNQDLGWDEMVKIQEPLWLRLSLGLWPYNLEHAKPGIGRKLQHRWQKVGRLWLEPMSTHGILESEPMVMKLNESKVIDLR